MAYQNLLASVSEEQVASLRTDPSAMAEPTFVVAVSHLIAYWVEIQSLGKLLGEAVDGGDTINPALWHPMRAPMFHAPDQVRELHSRLAASWSAVLGEQSVPGDDWYRVEIEKVLSVFQHAAERGECVLSAVKPTVDHARASKVRIPLRLDGGGA